MPSPTCLLAGLPLQLDEAACGASVSEYGGGSLEVKLVGRFAPQDARRALELGLRPDYIGPEAPDYGQVELRLETRHVFTRPGGVWQALTFYDGRTDAHSQRVYVDGVDIGLGFYGPVELAGDVVRFGASPTEPAVLKRGYDERPQFTCFAEMRIDPAALNLERYRFTSLGEVAHVDPTRVRILELTDPAFAELPEVIRGLTGLAELSLVNSMLWRGHRLPLAALPFWIVEMPALARLSVAGAELAELPRNMQRLERLRSLAILHCRLTELPPALWHMRGLERIILDDNRIRFLSGYVDLPEVLSISLKGNELETLHHPFPAACPKLRRLDLRQNPWRELPKSLAEVPDLQLDIADRNRFLESDYPMAGSDVARTWDERWFLAAADADLAPRLEAALAAPELAPVADFIRLTARRALGVKRAAAEDYGALGNTRFGGMPDLPAGVDYPRYRDEDDDGAPVTYAYEFIAQLDCAALAPLQEYLPRTGRLYFFLSTVHDLYGHPRDEDPAGLVWHLDGPREELVSGATLRPATEDYYEMSEPSYEAWRVDVEKVVSAVSFYPLPQNLFQLRDALERVGHPEADFDRAAADAADETFSEAARGYRHFVGSYAFSQHELPETEAASARGGDPADWFTLLEVGSYGGMQWGDAGELHYCIHKADLARGDFSKVTVGMYSS